MGNMSERVKRMTTEREAVAKKWAEGQEVEKARAEAERQEAINRRRLAMEQSGVLKAVQELKQNELKEIDNSELYVSIESGSILLTWGKGIWHEETWEMWEFTSALPITVFADGDIIVGSIQSGKKYRGWPHAEHEFNFARQKLFTREQWSHDPGPLLDAVAEWFVNPNFKSDHTAKPPRHYYGRHVSEGEHDRCCS